MEESFEVIGDDPFEIGTTMLRRHKEAGHLQTWSSDTRRIESIPLRVAPTIGPVAVVIAPASHVATTPRERRSSRRTNGARAPDDDGREPPPARRCENPECGLPLGGRPNKHYCNNACRQAHYRYRNGAQPRQRPGPAPRNLRAGDVRRLRALIHLEASRRLDVRLALHGANGNRAALVDEETELTRALDLHYCELREAKAGRR
jgi:hypothetical protein